MNRPLRSFVFLILNAALLASGSAIAATPSSGTLTTTSGPVTYESGPFVVANPTPVPVVDSGPQCTNPVQPCDNFALTVTLPDDFTATNPNAIIKFTLSWDDVGAGVSDYDFYVYEGTVTTTDGTQAARVQGASQANPETTALRAFNGTRQFTVKVVPYTASTETVNVKIELAEGAGGGGGGGDPVVFGDATPTAPGRPRYQNFYAPDGSLAQGSSGEANIGFNPFSGNIMMMASAPVFRITPPELREPPLPKAGPAEWTNVSPRIASAATVDPILVTDPATGRTFISNQFFGANLLFAYTDDDGETWIEASISPPHGGIDHQTIAVGPYPEPLAGQNPVYPNAVYYCSQALVPDFCQRSDTGGASFGPGKPVNTGVTTLCGGLHGHAKVAPNGTVYLPDASCGANQGGTLSTNAGVTWQEFIVPDSAPGHSDPSIAIARDDTVYFCYVTGSGAWVAVSHDNGETWEPSVNISAAAGVKNAVFPEAVAGDPDRAACGFLGTNVSGNFQGLGFPGKWYLFIAHTYDGGKTWTTVNATPNDPVQGAGGICTGGLGCGSNRNLLDFNEVTMDDRGRVLFGYTDGCVSETCIESGGEQNDFVAYWRVARQFGGRPLLAEFDPMEPTRPEAPYLAGTRTEAKATLHWNPPNNGGAEITAYRILRGESAGAGSEIATVSGTKTRFVDAAVDPAVAQYFYRVVAVNAQGAGPASNEVALEVTTAPVQNFCESPGPALLTDTAGDSLTGTPGTDLKSFQLAQPFAEGGNIKLRFQINTDPGVQPQPPQSYWYVSFETPAGTVHGVRMVFKETSPATPIFESYIAGASTGGGVDGRFVEAGTEQPAAPGSFYDPANGTIVIVVPISDLGIGVGDSIHGFNSAAIQAVSTPVAGGALTVDEMPNGLGRQGAYTVMANAECAAASNTPPLAVLMAEPTAGNPPLTVAFDGSASADQDNGDSVESYTFTFGDGSAPVTQATPTVSHTYHNAGNFRAELTVTDSRGAESENAAAVVITVQTPTQDVTDRVKLRAGNAALSDGVASFDLRLENVSDAFISAPLRTEIVSLESQSGNVTAADADNGEPGPGAFWRYDRHLGGDSELASGEISGIRNLRFNDPNGEPFNVTFRVISGPEPAPGNTTADNEDAPVTATLIRLTVNPLLGTIAMDLL